MTQKLIGYQRTLGIRYWDDALGCVVSYFPKSNLFRAKLLAHRPLVAN